MLTETDYSPLAEAAKDATNRIAIDALRKIVAVRSVTTDDVVG